MPVLNPSSSSETVDSKPHRRPTFDMTTRIGWIRYMVFLSAKDLCRLLTSQHQQSLQQSLAEQEFAKLH